MTDPDHTQSGGQVVDAVLRGAGAGVFIFAGLWIVHRYTGWDPVALAERFLEESDGTDRG